MTPTLLPSPLPPFPYFPSLTTAADQTSLAPSFRIPLPGPVVDYTAAMRDPYSGRLKAVGAAEAAQSDAQLLYREMVKGWGVGGGTKVEGQGSWGGKGSTITP